MAANSNAEGGDTDTILLVESNSNSVNLNNSSSQDEHPHNNVTPTAIRPGNQSAHQNRTVSTVVVRERSRISTSSQRGCCTVVFILILAVVKIVYWANSKGSSIKINYDFDSTSFMKPDYSEDSGVQYGGGYEVKLPQRHKSYELEDVYNSTNITSGSCSTPACKNAVEDLINSLNTSVNPCDNFYEFACQGWQKNNPRPSYEDKWNVFNKLEKEIEEVVKNILEKPEDAGNGISSDSMALKNAKQFYKSCMNVKGSSSTNANRQDKEMLRSMWNVLVSYGGWPLLYKEGEWSSYRFNWVKSMVDLKRRFGRSILLDISSFQSPDGNKTENMIVIRNPSTSSKGLNKLDRVTGDDKMGLTVANFKKFIVNVSKELLIFKGEKNINETYLEEKAFEILIVQARLLEIRDKVADLKFKQSKGFHGNEAEITVDKLQRILDKYIYLWWDKEMDLKKLLDTLYEQTGVTISKSERVYVTDVDYLLELSKFLSYIKPDALANYLHFQMAMEMASMTTSRMQDYADKLENSLDGTVGQKPRSSVCVGIVQKKFPQVLGQAYIKERYPNVNDSVHDFVEAGEMFKQVKESLSQTILQSPLMSTSILKAIRLNFKVDYTYLCTGYPTWLYDDDRVQEEYNGLDIRKQTFMEQTFAVNAWSADKELKTLREPLDIETDECKWDRFAGTVGAYNEVLRYLVYLPAGILQSPFFNLDFPSVLKYARLGFVMGHELTHGLTTSLSELEDGGFTPEAKCFIQQYDGYSTTELRLQNVTLNGKSTLSENIPDNVGLREAYRAYKKLNESTDYNGKWGEVLEKYTHDQLFFIGFAQTFCESVTTESLKFSLRRDEHSPDMFRVLGTLRNSNEFTEAWNCPVGSNMNPVPSEHTKCSIFGTTP